MLHQLADVELPHFDVLQKQHWRVFFPIHQEKGASMSNRNDKGVGKTQNVEELLPSAKEAMKTIAMVEAEKAAQHMKHAKDGGAEKRELIKRLQKPTGLSREERIELAARIIKRAVDRGLTEVEVYRFPNELCTDRGRAINQAEPGWENTLTGVPREVFDLWREHLQPRGYKIRYQIVEYPNGMPGDVGVTLSWR
jgi:hypothetical protein